MSIRDLDFFFRPSSIAVVGASKRPGSVGAVLMNNLMRAGFDGPIMPVNPHYRAIGGALAWPTVADLPWVVGVGVAGYSAHYCMTRAFRLADATLVVPLDFLRLPLIAVVGALFYREPIELATMLGAVVMFAGTYYSVSRESRARPATAATAR